MTQGTNFNDRVGVIILGAVGVIGGLTSFKIMNSVGRRPLLIFGYAVIAMCHVAIGFLTIYEKNIANLSCLCLFIFLY